MTNVVEFPLEFADEAIIAALHRAGIKEFVLIGYDRDGLERIVSDLEQCGDILWHLRRTEHKMMRAADGVVCLDDSPTA
jgi:hypothetical protein